MGNISNDDCLSQLIVDVISAVLYRHRAATFAAGNDRHRFTAVAAEGKQKCIQVFIFCFDPLDNVLFSFLCN